ncbi:MAG: hypothetical protein QW091_01280 [Candidatus Micrarchaeaceae archaeon]
MSAINISGKDLISTQDWSLEELKFVIESAKEIKRMKYLGNVPELFKNKTMFMLFYNTSTRTRSSFESAATLLGGHAQFIDFKTTRGSEGESIADTAHMYERLGHVLGIRILEEAVDYVYGAGDALIREYAKHANIPVINMADDMYHPTQAIADMLTIDEKLQGNYKNKKYVISWAYSNHVRSWGSVQDEMLIASKFGMHVVLAYPQGFDLDERIVDQARANAEAAGTELEIMHDMGSALDGADVVFPRSWASHACVTSGMNRFGSDNEVKLHEQYKDWRLTQKLVDRMSSNAIITHVLPVFRGQEADNEVMDSARSVIYDQAENLLYVRAALLALLA